MRISTTIALSVTLLAPTLSAQKTELQTFAQAGQRAESSFFVAKMQDGEFAGAAGAVFLTYGTPEWKPEYSTQVDNMKGKLFRLGKDWWATFDTMTPVSFGGVTIPAGVWYLGVSCDKTGKWSLAFLEPNRVKNSGVMPNAADNAPRTHDVPLAMAKSGAMAKTLACTFEQGSDATHGKLTIAWGDRTLTTSFEVKVSSNEPKNASADKDGKKGD